MKRSIFNGVVVGMAMLGMAFVAGAQGPPRGEGFGPGPGGPGPGGPGPGGPMGREGRCIAPCTAYQFTYTRTSTQPVMVNGSASTVTNTTTGTIARDTNGSSYNEVKFSGGPWASQSGPQEFIYIRNLDPSVMMNYIVNVTKKSYEQFSIRERPARPNGDARPNRPADDPNKSASGNGPTRTTVANYPISDSTYICPSAEKMTMTRTIQLPGSGGTSTITSTRVFCPALQLMIDEDQSDPRFGTSTYKLSNHQPAPLPGVSFTPDSSFTLIKGRNFDRRGGPGKGPGRNQPQAQ